MHLQNHTDILSNHLFHSQEVLAIGILVTWSILWHAYFVIKAWIPFERMEHWIRIGNKYQDEMQVDIHMFNTHNNSSIRNNHAWRSCDSFLFEGHCGKWKDAKIGMWTHLFLDHVEIDITLGVLYKENNQVVNTQFCAAHKISFTTFNDIWSTMGYPKPWVSKANI